MPGGGMFTGGLGLNMALGFALGFGYMSIAGLVIHKQFGFKEQEQDRAFEKRTYQKKYYLADVNGGDGGVNH